MNIKSRLQLVLTLLLLPVALGSLDSLQHEDDDLVFDDMDEESLAQQPLIHSSPTVSHHHHDRVIVQSKTTDDYKQSPSSPPKHQNKIERLWSLPDVTTTTGHVFKLKIPSKAFGGNVHHYEVSGSNKKALPRWLFFDESTFTLMGVPSNKDVGQHHVNVKAYGMTTSDDDDDVANDVFTIRVIDDKNNQDNEHKNDKNSCDLTRQTLMTLVLDVRFDELKSHKKVKTLENLANHLGFHVDSLLMSNNDNINDGQKNNKSDNFTVLFTGPGNVKHRKNNSKHGTVIQWQVGCDGKLWKNQSAELLKVIRRQAKDKTLAKAIQLPVVFWQVKTSANVNVAKNEKENKMANKKKKKTKKVESHHHHHHNHQEQNEKHDLVGPSHRDRREVGSGDYSTNNDNDDYEDNYDEDYDETFDDNERGDDGDDNNEAITEIPRKLIPSGGIGSNSESRIIEEPEPEPEPEPEHPHRHHHGQKQELDQQETTGWKQQSAEHINEYGIVSSNENNHRYRTDATSTASIATAQETTLQTTPTTTTSTDTTPSSIPSSSSSSSSTTQSPHSTLSTITTTPNESKISSSFEPQLPVVSSIPSTTLKTTTLTTTINEASITINSESIEESNGIDGYETSLPPQIEKITLESDTISPTTFSYASTTLFNPFMSSTSIFATSADEKLEVKTTTNNNNIIDQEFTTSTASTMQNSPEVTTRELSKFTTIPSIDNNRFNNGESSTKLTTSFSESTINPSFATSFITSLSSTAPTRTVFTTSSETVSTFAPYITTMKNNNSFTDETRGGVPTIITETKEYGVRNYPPRQNKRLQKVPITAGKPLSYFIPADTFSDLEDGNTRNLKLSLYLKGNLLNDDNHWLQLNSETQEIYGLPLENDVSVWDYDLVASDHQGLNVSDHLFIYVQQHRSSHSINHEFSMHLKINTKHFPTRVDWELKVVESLAELYGDLNTNQITVRSIDISISDPSSAVFTWTNDSIPRSSKCPKDEINKLLYVLVANKDGDPSAMLQKVLAPTEIRVKKVMFKGLRQCDDMNNQPQVVPPSQLPPVPLPPQHGGQNELDPSSNKPPNNSPMPRNQVDHISAVVGQLLVFRVPKDTFFDPEDGPTRDLKLTLLTSDRTPIPPNNWLQFDVNNQEFYGVPMAVGRKEYQLIATDKGGASANDNLVVVVEPASAVKPSAEFTIKLGVAYRVFSQSAMLKKNFIQKLRKLFDDKDTDAISITSISPAPGDNNTIITWRNTTLPTAYCPDDEITRLSEVLFVKPDNKELSNKIESIMGKEFPVDQLTLTPMEICLGEFTRVHSHNSGNGRILPPIDRDDDDSTALGASRDDYLITFVLPAIIISAMLILAGIIACVLYKRKRSGKMSVSERDDDERQTFKSKGIPVIFQDELEEKPDPVNKSPVILKEEKPPLPPPEYQQQKINDDDDDDGANQPMLPPKESEEPYQPPPPFARTSDNTRQNRPKPTPTYRKPPPYVPP